MQRPEPSYHLIADITGYTRFLTGSELDHARGILEQLFSALLDKLRSPFLLSNVQGDAILAHARARHIVDGGHVLDIVEGLYCGFAESLEHMLVNTTCTCAACRNNSNLDLKLLVHYGEYIKQNIAGRQELNGSEVILIHRLLKNSITSATGIRAYAVFRFSQVRRATPRPSTNSATSRCGWRTCGRFGKPARRSNALRSKVPIRTLSTT
jgi:hypothetical protein